MSGLKRLEKMRDEEEKHLEKVKEDRGLFWVRKKQIEEEEELAWEQKKITEKLREKGNPGRRCLDGVRGTHEAMGSDKKEGGQPHS